MAHSFLDVTFTETPQEQGDTAVSALDKVVDPYLEFQNNSVLVSPNEAFNLPKCSSRKHSFASSLQRKLSYKVDENELPKVHKSPSIQNVANMLKKKKLRRNFSESSDCIGSNQTLLSSLQNISHNSDRESVLNTSPATSTPNVDNISFHIENSPIIPHYVQDRLETASNISLASNVTDVPDSNISSVSDLTGYEEEICQIKKLLFNGSSHSNIQENYNNTKQYVNDVSEYEQKIIELTAQLQIKCTENEKLKFELKDVERKCELSWQDKFQSILRQKSYLEGQLDTLRKQYETALSEKDKIISNLNQNKNELESNSIRSEYTKLQLKLNNLEKANAALNSRLILVSNESKQWHKESVKNESENEKLCVTIQELTSQLDSKSSVLFELKNKITEQHIEIHNYIQSKLKLNNHITTLNNEIEAVKKSEKWYIDQLHSCQISKSNIQKELMSTQTHLITANQKFENMKMEVTRWKYLCEETQRKAIREKEKLLRRVEMIEADMVEREALLKCAENEDAMLQRDTVIKNVADRDYNIVAEEYKDQVTNLRKTLEEKQSRLEKLEKEVTEYLVRITTLQKKLNDKETCNQVLEDRNRDLEMRNNSNNEALRTKDNTILELRNKIVTLEVALHSAAREKAELDEIVKNVRDDFNKFMKCYKNMKEKLDEKTKIITQFEQDKQELFMENNWRKCEIEELQQRLLNVKSLQAEIMELKNIYNEAMIEKDALVKENDSLSMKNQELQANCDNLRIKISTLEEKLIECKSQDIALANENVASLTKDVTNLENEILKLNEMLRIREKQLENQTQNCEIFNKDIEEREKLINDLKQKLSDSESTLEKFNKLASENENIITNLRAEVCVLNKKVSDANTVIDQFNMLCRNSELEKHNLSTQLNLLRSQKCRPTIADDKETQYEFHNSNGTCDWNKNYDNFSQTELSDDAEILQEMLETIKLKLSELVSENNIETDNSTPTKKYEKENFQNSNNFNAINEYLNKILYFKETQIKQVEASEKMNSSLRRKVLKLKNKINYQLRNLSERCMKLDENYAQIHNVVNYITHYQNNIKTSSSSVSVQTNAEGDQYFSLTQEIKDLKSMLRVSEMERKEQYRRFEMNNRTLLRKVKEHIRGRKIIEKNFTSLQDTYKLALNEINNLKILNSRAEIELETFRVRCDEYKGTCEKLNETIINLEREKGKSIVGENPVECLNCLELNKISQMFADCECKYKNLEEKMIWYEKELNDKEQGITECKKQLFIEKLQNSALKKQLASIQMCLDNANEQLDVKQVEFTRLKAVLHKLHNNETLLIEQVETAQSQCQEHKRKFEGTCRLLEETKAKDEILADEIKTLSCHLHQKTLELTNLQNNLSMLESQSASKENNYQKNIDELKDNLAELQNELSLIRSDKFFLQRLCADLKMSLQSTLNQNKVLKQRLEALETETKDLSLKLKCGSLSSVPSPSKIDEEYINELLQQSTVLPDKPLKNLRSCLDSLKEEMATLQKEIIAKTQPDISL